MGLSDCSVCTRVNTPNPSQKPQQVSCCLQKSPSSVFHHVFAAYIYIYIYSTLSWLPPMPFILPGGLNIYNYTARFGQYCIYEIQLVVSEEWQAVRRLSKFQKYAKNKGSRWTTSSRVKCCAFFLKSIKRCHCINLGISPPSSNSKIVTFKVGFYDAKSLTWCTGWLSSCPSYIFMDEWK